MGRSANFRKNSFQILGLCRVAFFSVYISMQNTDPKFFIIAFILQDLQVKSSPPIQPTPSINNDPAIIQVKEGI